MSLPVAAPVSDRLGRGLADLRVSVTDRCNFRCRYCMPREVFGPGFAFLEREELLTFEEITRVVRVFAGLGVRKVRLTGGEPLLRRDLDRLVAMLARTEGLDDLALTTNGSLLAGAAEGLRRAGLRRVTVSLDSLDDAVFRAMSDVAMPVARVLEGIEAAVAAGLEPVKVNAVVQRGVNDGGLLDLARWGRDLGVVVRFIEYMDVGTTNGWRLDDVVPAEEIVRRIDAELPLEPIAAVDGAGAGGSGQVVAGSGQVAERWRYADGRGEVGIVSSVTRPFCSTCTRARLSAVGEVFTCLFGAQGHDLRGPLRDGATDDELTALVAGTWRARTDRYSELRAAGTTDLPKVEMSYIGG